MIPRDNICKHRVSSSPSLMAGDICKHRVSGSPSPMADDIFII